jgi:DNA-binding PadR family transcriptional regulator
MLLSEAPRNGYQLIQEIEERSAGAWRPSPGSIYPVLNQLEDEGLVRPSEQPSGRLFELTERGVDEVARLREAVARPWDDAAAAAGEGGVALVRSLKALVVAVRSMREIAAPEQVAGAVAVLDDARRRIYQILAEETPTGGAE